MAYFRVPTTEVCTGSHLIGFTIREIEAECKLSSVLSRA
jgi:hypothetical protein